MMQTTGTSTDLLSEDELYLVRADTGKRLLNYIIDLVIFYIVLFLLAIVVGLLSPDTLNDYVNNQGDEFDPLESLVLLLIYAVYMGIAELVFKGKSIGKLITGTRAVNMDGSRITTGTAFSRGLARAVPFCVFSALGSPCNPWQDRWTKTLVIDEKKTAMAKLN